MSMKNYVQNNVGTQKLHTSQREAATPEQVENSAGGFTFKLDEWGQLDRFLILGSDSPTYYAGAKELTLDNAKCVGRCLQMDGPRTVARVVEVSVAGRAPKNTPAIFVLATACADPNQETRKAAFEAIPKVCRIGTHLFEFMTAVRSMRGLGKGLAKAVTRWYTGKAPDQLAYQLVKYQQRAGMSHRDVLRLTRRHGARGELAPAMEAALRWTVAHDAVGLTRQVTRKTAAGEVSRDYKTPDLDALPKILAAHDEIVALDKVQLGEAIKIVKEHRLTHEMVPSHFLGEAKMWEAMLPHMPLGAMTRNLGRMTANGLIDPMSASELFVSEQFSAERIIKARLHPLQVLMALKTYQQGHGVKGKMSWSPSRRIVDALDEAFYHSFGNVQATGKRYMLALDVSSSMSFDDIAGMPGITPRIGSAAMAMITARMEKNWCIAGFCSSAAHAGPTSWNNYHLNHGITQLNISPRQRLDDVIKSVSGLPFGGTDCSLPMAYARQEKLEIDTFVIYTDNETWAGNVHPHQVLRDYRQKMGIDAKLVVVGMTATPFTIAAPADPGMLDVVGFDTASPNIISSFSKGEL